MEFLKDMAQRLANLAPSALETANAVWTDLRSLDPERAALIAAALAAFVALRFLRPIAAGLIGSSKAPDNAVRNVVARLVGNTWSVFLLVAAFAAVGPLLDLGDTAEDVLRSAVLILGALQGAVWARELLTSVVLGYASQHASDRSALRNAQNVLHVLVGAVVWSMAALFILSNVGVNVTALVAGLGVGGIAVGFAAQGIVRDLFSSISIVLDRPFARGDFIAFDEFMGTVERIGLKTTRLTALSGEQLVISNTNVLEHTIRNYQLMRERRIVFGVGVLYDTPHAKLAAIPGWVETIVKDQSNARFDRAHFKAFGQSSLDFEFVYYVTAPEYGTYMDVQQAINLAIVEKFLKEGVGFAFPTRTVHVVGDQVPGDS